jgi:hypothetical protein
MRTAPLSTTYSRTLNSEQPSKIPRRNASGETFLYPADSIPCRRTEGWNRDAEGWNRDAEGWNRDAISLPKGWNRDAISLPRSLGSKLPSILIASRFPLLGL